MSEEESKDLDEDIEAYDAQDDMEEKVQLPPEQDLNQLLKDISCLLGGLNGQLQVLETTIKQLATAKRTGTVGKCHSSDRLYSQRLCQ